MKQALSELHLGLDLSGCSAPESCVGAWPHLEADLVIVPLGPCKSAPRLCAFRTWKMESVSLALRVHFEKFCVIARFVNVLKRVNDLDGTGNACDLKQECW